jgi:hypothetical protein
MQELQVRAGLDAELIHQRPPGLLVGVQRFCLATGTGQRLH